MSSVSTLFKLAELRAKTDRELVWVIDRELELGLRFALLAEQTETANGLGPARGSHVRAEAAYAEAAKLLPRVDDPGERRRLERKLKHLRDALGRRSAPHEARVQLAYS